MQRIVVLGAGRVGAAIARDLARDGEYEVTAVDVDPARVARLDREMTTSVVDLSDPARVAEVARRPDVVVLAVPGAMGFDTLKTIIDVGTPVVDISFSEQSPFALDTLAKERDTLAIVDAGIAPGLSNLLLGQALATNDSVEAFGCYVGGLPADPAPPFHYKAPFSPTDVIEEYTRPARYRVAGEDRTSPALSGLETIEIEGVGRLEAFLTDGLRSLLALADVPTMWEKTLRYPGHAAEMRFLRDLGLFDTTPRRLGGRDVTPRDIATDLLFPVWSYEPGEPDLTAFRVDITATRDGIEHRYRHELLDRHDATTDTSSMARTTGYTCAATVRSVLRGEFNRHGVFGLEELGRESRCCRAVLADLGARGITLTTSSTDG